MPNSEPSTNFLQVWGCQPEPPPPRGRAYLLSNIFNLSVHRVAVLLPNFGNHRFKWSVMWCPIFSTLNKSLRVRALFHQCFCSSSVWRQVEAGSGSSVRLWRALSHMSVCSFTVEFEEDICLVLFRKKLNKKKTKHKFWIQDRNVSCSALYFGSRDSIIG